MTTSAALDASTASKIVNGTVADVFAHLGRHPHGEGWAIRAYVPGAERVTAVAIETGETIATLSPDPTADFFSTVMKDYPPIYGLKAERGSDTWDVPDPYPFAPVMGPQDEHYLAEGSHLRLWERLGAHPMTHEGVEGCVFAVWAPDASHVSVVGDFNDWDGRRHVMRPRGTTGVWEIFVPGVGDGVRYKYEIKDRPGRLGPLKADPVGFGSEHPPANSSVVRDLRGHAWRDEAWMSKRAARNAVTAPISIYEVHLPSWRRAPGGRPLSYKELGEQLVPYVKEMGFTHIETLPVSEYPFDGSWGYQPVGMYAPTIRHGTPGEFRDFVEACHAAEIGLIIDWVPAHFPTDQHGLGRFDGNALYEHADPKEGFHPDWNTFIYNYGRREVGNYLIANALYWLKEHHIDGLRVDAVASMLYRDYSRKAGEWVPNRFGGRENLEAVEFLRRMNTVVYGDDPSVMTVAEESTAWPGVSKPVDAGGLGFGYKWNMGWMHDSLSYMGRDPIYRRYHHHQMTFGLLYAFSENFVLPLSHDEVVHGKGSIIARMPGDEWQQFANLRAYYAFMWSHPGKKLLFMGSEWGQRSEWAASGELEWAALGYDKHEGVQKLVRDLNGLYSETPALHERDCRADGFEWVEADAADRSIYAFLRRGEGDTPPALCVFNFTPEPSSMRLGVPEAGRWVERINSDAALYGGSGMGNLGGLETEDIPSHGHPCSLQMTVPPLAGVVFTLAR
jgi:1,4-alpha-glucan branching enzyme